MTRRTLLFTGTSVLAFAGLVVAQEGFIDDFADGKVFDGNPVPWATAQELVCGDNCCHGVFDASSGDLIVRNTSGSNTFLGTDQRYEGDLSLRARVNFDGAGRLGLVLHHVGCINQYGCTLNSRGEAWVYRWQDGTFTRLSETVVEEFIPESDYLLQLDRKDDLLELRIWRPGQPTPSAPLIAVRDGSFTTGRVGLHYFREENDAKGIFRFIQVSRTLREEGQVQSFSLGDTNDDGKMDISDAVTILRALFLGDRELSCLDAANVNADLAVDISDAVYLLGALFLGNVDPIPDPACSGRPSPDSLGCAASAQCPQVRAEL